MEKYRIRQDGDNVLVDSFVWKKKQPDETDKEFMDRHTIDHPVNKLNWENQEFKDIDETALPERSTRPQWYPDFAENGESYIKVDTNWEIKVMDVWIIRQKYMARINAKIDAELDNSISDPMTLIRYNREKEQATEWTDAQWYQKALANMDEDRIDKPTIRQKLADKINGNTKI